MGRLTVDEARRWTRVGVLAAFALVLGYLETFVPIPVPGVKLGLANIAILLCFLRLDASSALFVTLIKVLAQGLLFGSPLTFAYSLTGSLLAFAVMAATVRIGGMHPVMVSILGAVAHTAGQMLVAALLLGTRFVWLAAPVLAIAAIVTGALCGVLAVRLDRALDERAEAPRADAPAIVLDALPDAGSKPVGAILAAFAVYAVAVIVQDSFAVLAVLFGCAVVACIAARPQPSAVVHAVRTFAVLFAVSVIATYVSTPDDAVRSISVMVLRLLSVLGMSIAVMGLVSTDELVAFMVRTSRRLENHGIPMQGPLLALNVCLQTVPALAAGAKVDDVRLMGQAFTDTIADAYLQADAIAESVFAQAGEED